MSWVGLEGEGGGGFTRLWLRVRFVYIKFSHSQRGKIRELVCVVKTWKYAFSYHSTTCTANIRMTCQYYPAAVHTRCWSTYHILIPIREVHTQIKRHLVCKYTLSYRPTYYVHKFGRSSRVPTHGSARWCWCLTHLSFKAVHVALYLWRLCS